MYGNIPIPVQTNTYKPTLGSMFTVYLGMHDVSGVSAGDLKGGIKMTVKDVIRVSLWSFLAFEIFSNRFTHFGFKKIC